MSPRIASIALCLGAFLALPSPLAAQSAATAPDDEIVHQGVEALRAHRFDAALALFTQAYAMGHHPKARAEMGLTEQILGRWAEAEMHLREALAATADPWILAHRADLDAALGEVRSHTTTLEVRANVLGSELWIARQRIGTLPLPEPVVIAAGTVAFEVRATGYQTVQRTTLARAREAVMESVELAPSMEVAQHTVPTAVPASPPPSSSGPVERSVPTHRASRPFPWPAGVGLGLAGAGVVVGVVGIAIAQPAAAAYDNPTNACPAPPPASAMGLSPACRDAYNAAPLGNGLMIAGFVAGGALLGASVIGLVIAGRGGAGTAGEQALRRFSCGVGPGVVGGACTVVF